MIKKGKESPGEKRERLKQLKGTLKFKHKGISLTEFRKKVIQRVRSPNLINY